MAREKSLAPAMATGRNVIGLLATSRVATVPLATRDFRAVRRIAAEAERRRRRSRLGRRAHAHADEPIARTHAERLATRCVPLK